jgi:predicted amidophosphoribosyltransferase
MNKSTNLSPETFACVRCGAAVPVSAAACPACGLEVFPTETLGEGECRCAACGGDMAIDDKICPRCGTEVVIQKTPEDELFCSECGGEVAEADTVCPHCGTDFEEGEVPDAEPEEDEEYVCSSCGRDVAANDKTCPHCGADVEEIEETPAEPGQAEPKVFTLTLREINFLKEAERLPEACAASITPADGEKLIIPGRNPKVGDIVVQFVLSETIVSVGQHTEGRFLRAADAVDLIRDIVTDQIIFHFVDREVEVYRAEELDRSEAPDWNDYSWSGPLRNNQSGIG